MQLLDGKLASQAIRDDLREKISGRKEAGRKIPHLAAILVGKDPASETYVASKVRNCGEIGMISTLIRLEEDVPQQELLDRIAALNGDPDVDGILVQLPLPPHISEQKIIDAIDPSKDVDGFHPENVGRMVLDLPSFVSATPAGILLLLRHYRIRTAGMHAVVIGRSHIVGRPISILLSRNGENGNATVTLCHSRTKDLAGICRQADLVVAAIGRPKFVTASMIKDGAVVIDVGINRVPDPSRKSGFALVGDVDFENVAPNCSYISPVRGGVGLMTIAALLTNPYQACSSRDGGGTGTTDGFTA